MQEKQWEYHECSTCSLSQSLSFRTIPWNRGILLFSSPAFYIKAVVYPSHANFAKYCWYVLSNGSRADKARFCQTAECFIYSWAYNIDFPTVSHSLVLEILIALEKGFLSPLPLRRGRCGTTSVILAGDLWNRLIALKPRACCRGWVYDPVLFFLSSGAQRGGCSSGERHDEAMT